MCFFFARARVRVSRLGFEFIVLVVCHLHGLLVQDHAIIVLGLGLGLGLGLVCFVMRMFIRVRYKCERSDKLNPFHMQAAICCRGEQDLRGHCRFELWSTSGSSKMPDLGGNKFPQDS